MEIGGIQMKTIDFKGVVYALPINIYKWNLTDCSNNGITSRNNELLLVGMVDAKTKEFTPLNNGFIEIDFNKKNLNKDNLCLVVKRHLFGEEQHDYIVGLKDFIDGKWCMMGGCFGYSCDSRFCRDINRQPLPIHDRIED